MSNPIRTTLGAAPSLATCLLGSPVRPETVRQFAGLLHTVAAVRCQRLVTHTVSHHDTDLLASQPSGSSAVYTRWTLGPLVGRVIVGVRYQASRPKDGASACEIEMLLRRASDDEAIDAAMYTADLIPSDPTDSLVFAPRWLWTPLDPVEGPAALDATGWSGTAAELAMSGYDVRFLSVIAIEVAPREVG